MASYTLWKKSPEKSAGPIWGNTVYGHCLKTVLGQYQQCLGSRSYTRVAAILGLSRGYPEINKFVLNNDSKIDLLKKNQITEKNQLIISLWCYGSNDYEELITH